MYFDDPSNAAPFILKGNGRASGVTSTVLRDLIRVEESDTKYHIGTQTHQIHHLTSFQSFKVQKPITK